MSIKRIIVAFSIVLASVIAINDAHAQTVNSQMVMITGRDLTIGSRGTDVATLQSFLVSKGYLTMPLGTTPGYFGNLTKMALARYQASMGIQPAAGYFGPVTRARVNAELIASVPRNPVVQDDDEDMDDDMDDDEDTDDGEDGEDDGDEMFTILAEEGDQEVRGGQDNIQILAFELGDNTDAEDVDSLTLLFSVDDGNNDDDEDGSKDEDMDDDDNTVDEDDEQGPWNFIESISVWSGDDRIAQMDADSARDWMMESDDSDDDTVYSFEFDNLMLEDEDMNDDEDEDTDEEDDDHFYISITMQDDLDDDTLPQIFDVTLEGAGNDEEVTVTVSSNLDEGTVRLFAAGRSTSRTVTVDMDDEDGEEGDVELFNFMIESGANIMIDQLPVHIELTSGATRLSDVFDGLTLLVGGESRSSKEITSSYGDDAQVTFDDLNARIEAGEEFEFTLVGTVDERFSDDVKVRMWVDGEDVIAGRNNENNNVQGQLEVTGRVTSGTITLTMDGDNNDDEDMDEDEDDDN
jgi:hypothetical protein